MRLLEKLTLVADGVGGSYNITPILG